MLLELSNRLREASKANDVLLQVELLHKLASLHTSMITKQSLKDTGAGRVVGVLRKHADSDIRETALFITDKWKRACGLLCIPAAPCTPPSLHAQLEAAAQDPQPVSEAPAISANVSSDAVSEPFHDLVELAAQLAAAPTRRQLKLKIGEIVLGHPLSHGRPSLADHGIGVVMRTAS